MHGYKQLLRNRKSLITRLMLFLIIVIGASLRIYNLDWGSPFYFHPDERNIASSISQIYFPNQLNPNFFAYGSLPIYVNYKLGVIQNIIASITSDIDIFKVSFEQAIINGRIISTILSTGVIFLIYKITRLFVSPKWSLLSAFLTSLSIGLIQYAHFGTFETYLTFFSLLLLLCLLKFIQTKKFIYYLFTSIIVGMLCAIKVSSFILLPLPLLALVLIFKERNKTFILKKLRKLIFPLLLHSLVLILITIGIFIISNPFTFLDWVSFRNSMQYESAVALGTLPVFYTGSFANTIPGIFHLLNIYPFVLNPVIAVLFVPAVLYLFLYAVLKRQSEYLFIVVFLLFLLIPQLIFYVKWTRYIIPTLPVIYLCLVLSLHTVLNKSFLKLNTYIRYSLHLLLFLIISSSFVWSLIFVNQVYVKPDTRVEAAQFLSDKFSSETPILSEVYDLGIIPFNYHFNNISLFNFYDLEHDPSLNSRLEDIISENEILILPSQRIIKSRLENPETFPNGYEFYNSLNNNPKYRLIYKTECDVWCKILYLGDPIYGIEDTINVFDRPTVIIYKIKHAN